MENKKRFRRIAVAAAAVSALSISGCAIFVPSLYGPPDYFDRETKDTPSPDSCADSRTTSDIKETYDTPISGILTENSVINKNKDKLNF